MQIKRQNAEIKQDIEKMRSMLELITKALDEKHG